MSVSEKLYRALVISDLLKRNLKKTQNAKVNLDATLFAIAYDSCVQHKEKHPNKIKTTISENIIDTLTKRLPNENIRLNFQVRKAARDFAELFYAGVWLDCWNGQPTTKKFRSMAVAFTLRGRSLTK